MSTSTISINSSWINVAAPNDVDILMSWKHPVRLEVATTSINALPSNSGHVFYSDTLITRDLIGEGHVWVRIVSGDFPNSIDLTVSKSDKGTPSPVSISGGNVTLTGPVTVSNEVEVSNSTGNPLPVSAVQRNCVGCQTLSVLPSEVSTLTVPPNAIAATIQADGGAVSITLNGSTDPTSTVGLRIDNGAFFDVDTPLVNVKLIARYTTTAVQVVYFDKV